MSEQEKSDEIKCLVRKGGLMRCCLQTLIEAKVKNTEGETLPCKYCKESMRFRDGAWEWNHEFGPVGPSGIVKPSN